MLTMLAGSALFVLLAVPFVVKLYRKWVGGHVTDAEKAQGMEGVRAWLGGGNVVCAGLLALCAWLGFGYSFWAIFALAMMALLAYPIVNLATQAPAADTVVRENLTQERERVMNMLHEGKITAEESADLLNALGQTVRTSTPSSTPMPPPRRLVLIGVALLVVGFFLPWFSINPGKELSRATNQMQMVMNDTARGMGSGQMMPPNAQFSFKMNTVHVRGGDIQHGLGWLVLLLGAGVAFLPFAFHALDSQTRWTLTFVGLSIGAVILVYLLTQNLRYVSAGIILGLAGYALEFLGSFKERQTGLA